MSGARDQRPRPHEFEIAFIEHGRLECEVLFRAGRNTITRWLKESGKARLLKRRAQFVKAKRSADRKGKARAGAKAEAKAAGRELPIEIQELAAQYLQRRAAGGWVVYQLECGRWMVGTQKRTPAELVAKAQEKGFDVRNAARQIAEFPENVRVKASVAGPQSRAPRRAARQH